LISIVVIVPVTLKVERAIWAEALARGACLFFYACARSGHGRVARRKQGHITAAAGAAVRCLNGHGFGGRAAGSR
jgi:hypothetical protein